jgi:uncharacterized protein with HEPN domain
MADRSVAARLYDILEAIEGIRRTTAGLDFAGYEEDWAARRATERGIEIISEASRHLPADHKLQHPDIPWREIAGIGNKLRHEYQRIEDRVLWNVVQRELEPLERAAREMLAGLDES